MKGFRHIDSKTVYRRIQELEKQGGIGKNCERTTKPCWLSELYEITFKGRTALKLDEKNIEDFLKVATEDQILKLIYLFD